MKTSTISVLLLSTLSAISVHAGDFDGTKPIICAVTDVVVCPRSGEAEKETPEGINLPQFFFIDVEKKMVSAKGPAGDTRQTRIETVRHEGGALILGGVQLGKAWHAVINEESGHATITGATTNTAFVVFAACTVSPAMEIKEAAGAGKDKSE